MYALPFLAFGAAAAIALAGRKPKPSAANPAAGALAEAPAPSGPGHDSGSEGGAPGTRVSREVWDSLSRIIGYRDGIEDLAERKVSLADPLYFTATTFEDSAFDGEYSKYPFTCRKEIAFRDSSAGWGIWKPVEFKFGIVVERSVETRDGPIVGVSLPGYRGFELRTAFTWVPGLPPTVGETYEGTGEDIYPHFTWISLLTALPAANSGLAAPETLSRDGEPFGMGRVRILGIGDVDGNHKPDYWSRYEFEEEPFLSGKREPSQTVRAYMTEPEGC